MPEAIFCNRTNEVFRSKNAARTLLNFGGDTHGQSSPRAGGDKNKTTYALDTNALDTNVLMHDPLALFHFKEDNVYLAAQVLSELDNHKKGGGEAQRNARAASRYLRALLTASAKKGIKLEDGIPLDLIEEGHGCKGSLFFEVPELNSNHPDDRIILAVKKQAEAKGAKKSNIVLVTKDNLAFIKAAAAGLACDDFVGGGNAEDDGFDVGVKCLDKMPRVVSCEAKDGLSKYVVVDDPSLCVGGALLIPNHKGDKPFRGFVGPRSRGHIELREIPEYTKNNLVWGIGARNEEQHFALNALMNPEIAAVVLTGTAGTGKTLLALAAGIEQVLTLKLYNEIIITRITVPIGEEIGFLPGNEGEKMGPWMGAFDDNLEVLNTTPTEGGEWGYAATQDLIRSRIKTKSLSFMRGRTLQHKFIIIDEAQNLDAKQMKALVTRVGPGSKMIILGNLRQIDTKGLNECTSGLARLAESIQKTSPPFMSHIGLVKGERHQLTDWANENL